MELDRLYYTLGIDTSELEKGIRKAENNFNNLLGTVTNVAASIGLAFGFKEVISGITKITTSFDSAMRQVWTLTNQTEEEFNKLKAAVIELSKAGPYSAEELSKALYQTISAGIDAKDAMGFLEQAMKAAQAGAADLFTSVDGLTTIMNAWGLSMDKLSAVSDKVFLTVKEGKTTFDELAASIGSVAPTAAQAGVSLDEILAATAALTKQGIETNRAMTSLNYAIQAIIAPSEQAKKTAKELGIEFNAAALKSKGLAGFLKEVYQSADGNTEILSKLFGSVEALRGVFALTGNAANDFTEILKEMGNSAGTTEEAAKKMADSLEFQLKRLKNSFDAVKLAWGEALVPLIKTVADIGESFAGWLEDMSPLEKALLGLGTALATIVPLMKTTSILFGILSGLTGNWAGILSAVGGAIAILTTVFGTLNEKIETTNEKLKEAKENINSFGETKVNYIDEKEVTAISKAANDFSELKEAVEDYNLALQSGYGDLEGLEGKIKDILNAHPIWKEYVTEINGVYQLQTEELKKQWEIEKVKLQTQLKQLEAQKELLENEKSVALTQKEKVDADIEKLKKTWAKIEELNKKFEENTITTEENFEYDKLTEQLYTLLNKYNAKNIFENMGFDEAIKSIQGPVNGLVNQIKGQINNINKSIETVKKSISDLDNSLKSTDKTSQFEEERKRLEQNISKLENEREKLLKEFEKDKTNEVLWKKIKANAELLENYYSMMKQQLQKNADYLISNNDLDNAQKLLEKKIKYDKQLKIPKLEVKYDYSELEKEINNKKSQIENAIKNGYEDTAKRLFSELKTLIADAEYRAVIEGSKEAADIVSKNTNVLEDFSKKINKAFKDSAGNLESDYNFEYFDKILEEFNKLDFKGEDISKLIAQLTKIPDFSVEDFKKLSEEMQKFLLDFLKNTITFEKKLSEIDAKIKYLEEHNADKTTLEKAYNEKKSLLEQQKEMILKNIDLSDEEKETLINNINTKLQEVINKIKGLKTEVKIKVATVTEDGTWFTENEEGFNKKIKVKPVIVGETEFTQASEKVTTEFIKKYDELKKAARKYFEVGMIEDYKKKLREIVALLEEQKEKMVLNNESIENIKTIEKLIEELNKEIKGSADQSKSFMEQFDEEYKKLQDKASKFFEAGLADDYENTLKKIIELVKNYRRVAALNNDLKSVKKLNDYLKKTENLLNSISKTSEIKIKPAIEGEITFVEFNEPQTSEFIKKYTELKEAAKRFFDAGLTKEYKKSLQEILDLLEKQREKMINNGENIDNLRTINKLIADTNIKLKNLATSIKSVNKDVGEIESWNITDSFNKEIKKLEKTSLQQMDEFKKKLEDYDFKLKIFKDTKDDEAYIDTLQRKLEDLKDLKIDSLLGKSKVDINEINTELQKTEIELQKIIAYQEAQKRINEELKQLYSDVAGLVRGLGEEFEELAKIIENLPDIIANVQAAITAMESGNPLGWILLAIQAIVTVITEIFSWSKKVAEINEKNKEIKETELELTEKLNKLNEKLYGSSKLRKLYEDYQSIGDKIKKIKELEKEFEKEKNKTGYEQAWWDVFGLFKQEVDLTDPEKLKEIAAQIEKLKDDIGEAVYKIADAFGFGTDQLASSLSDALDEAIANNMSYEEFVNKFSGTLKAKLKKAIIDTMVIQALEPQLQDLATYVGSAFGKDMKFSKDEIEQIKQMIQTISEGGAGILEGLKEVFDEMGLVDNVGEGILSTASDAIKKTLTEETGNRLAAIFNSMLLYTKNIDEKLASVITNNTIKVTVENLGSVSADEYLRSVGYF